MIEAKMIETGKGFGSLQGTGIPKNLNLHYAYKAQHTIALMIRMETRG